ncbi:MAG: PH domain-containing protein [Cyanobacteria bacterium J06648_1]
MNNNLSRNRVQHLVEKPIIKLKPNPWSIFIRKNPIKSLLTIISLLLIIPAFPIGLRWWRLRRTTYWISTQRIRVDSGIFDLEYDDIALFRVIDMKLKRPFLYRFIGLSDLYIDTIDKRNRLVVFRGVKREDADKLYNILPRFITIERNRVRPDAPNSWNS